MALSRRRTAATAAGALAILATVLAWAQPGEEEAVTRAVDTLFNAMKAADKAQLESITAPELSWGHSSGRVENRQEWVQSFEVLKPKTLDLSDRRVSVVGDYAIARHNFTAEAVNREGRSVPVRIGMMQVWQKRAGNWVLLAQQNYSRPAPP